MRGVVLGVGIGLWAMVVPFFALATHQVGGQLEMQSLSNGRYRIIVTNYFEAGPRASQQTGGALGVFRKRDNVQMQAFTVNETGQRQPVVFTNEFCAKQRNLNFIVATFEATIQLDAATYNDPQGYYISYQTRNRNAGINNITSPSQTGFTFYLEFPSLQQYPNSSPHFSGINGEYVCLGEPFTFPFGGTDPDGDELRYSMVTPLDQKGMGGPGQNGNNVMPAPYPDVSWLSGFSATRAMPGSPSLSVNPQSGQLSVTATQLGLYVFAVKVEEYRKGVKIGEVRRDFQFLVVDCPPATTPNPAVQIRNRPGITTASICQGDSAVLQATVDSTWNYQWRQDGINLLNATGPSLTVRQAGEYTVVVSPKTACSKAGSSQTVIISVIGNKASLFQTGHLCATTGSVQFTASGPTDVTYQWFRNNQPVAGQTTDSLRISDTGQYWNVLTMRTLGCVLRTDTAVVTRSPVVQALIQSATGQTRLCPQSTLPLTGSGGVSYAWQKDGNLLAKATATTYDVLTAGTYVITATDANGCEGTSPPFVVTAIPPVMVTLDSIPGVCGPGGPVTLLRGSPAGGVFAGAGVEGNTFSPQRAGVGNYAVTYTVKAAPECAGTVATRTAVVAPIPTIELPDSMTTFKGNTFTLAPDLTGNPTQFQWASATYLDDPTAASPSVMNIQGDITYTLAVSNSVGCTAYDTIHITVYERIWIPTAFSPNGDGLNDTWNLPGIEAFPEAVVTIFNRWGEVIYRSDKGYTNPFNGTARGQTLPAGVYAYTLHTVPSQPVVRGSLMLLR